MHQILQGWKVLATLYSAVEIVRVVLIGHFGWVKNDSLLLSSSRAISSTSTRSLLTYCMLRWNLLNMHNYTKRLFGCGLFIWILLELFSSLRIPAGKVSLSQQNFCVMAQAQSSCYWLIFSITDLRLPLSCCFPSFLWYFSVFSEISDLWHLP